MVDRVGPYRLKAGVDDTGLYFVQVYLYRGEQPVYESTHFSGLPDAISEARLYARAVLMVAFLWN